MSQGLLLNDHVSLTVCSFCPSVVFITVCLSFHSSGLLYIYIHTIYCILSGDFCCILVLFLLSYMFISNSSNNKNIYYFISVCVCISLACFFPNTLICIRIQFICNAPLAIGNKIQRQW